MSRSMDESHRRNLSSPPTLKRQANSLYGDLGRSEGIDENFDPPLESKYECPICLLGLKEPVQTQCGHRFCRNCIVRSLRDAGHKCPVDNEPLNESGLYPDNFAKREMYSFAVWCRLKKERGCPWKGPLKDLENHMQLCPFSDVSCPNSCGVKVQLREIEEHMNNCPMRKVSCEFCKKDIYFREREIHAQDCPKMPMTCPQCQQKHILREQMAQHLETQCAKTRSQCPFSFLGCTFEGYNPEVAVHLADHQAQHLIDVAKFVQKLQEERPEISANVSRSMTGPSTSSEEPISRRGEREAMYMSAEHSAVQQSTVPLQARSDELKRLHDKIVKLETRVIELEGRVCAGTFIWKIDNYDQCRREALNQSVPAIHSPPFYTSLYGYKLCLRMNLNGVDSGLNRHISLFVHMMHGDWDDILEWPFTGRITLAIMDQSENVDFRRPISETLVAKPNLLAFQKPGTQRNHKGYGYVEFCQIDQLRDGQFVKNNSMLVRIQVFH